MSQHKVDHASFTLERHYDAPVTLLYKAFSDQQAKSRWFSGGNEWSLVDRRFDFRVGGREKPGIDGARIRRRDAAVNQLALRQARFAPPVR